MSEGMAKEKGTNYYDSFIRRSWEKQKGFDLDSHRCPRGGGGEGGRGNPIYGLDQYVPPDRVWFLRLSILK